MLFRSQNPQGASRHTPLHFAVHPVVVVVVTLLVRSALLRYFASYQSPPVCSTRQTTKTSSPPLKLTLSRCSTYIYLVPLPHAIAGSALDSSANYLDLLLPVQLERRFLLFFHSPSSSCRFFFVLGSRAYSLVPLPFWRAFRRYGYPEAVATSKTSLESDPTIDTCTRTTQPLPLADIAAERFDDEPCVVIASAFHTLASQPRCISSCLGSHCTGLVLDTNPVSASWPTKPLPWRSRHNTGSPLPHFPVL